MDLSKLTNEELMKIAKIKPKFAGEVSKKTCGTSSSESRVQVSNPAPITIDTLKFGKVIVKPIDKNIGKEMFIKYHYSHKNVNTSKYYLGVFVNNELMGCASWGICMNPHSGSNIVKNAKIEDYLELNRLWVSDLVGKNIESIFIGGCFDWIKNNLPNIKWLQTFADGRIGVGTIYQATNWLYCGYHYSRFWKDTKTGEFYHDSLITRTTRKKYKLLQKIKSRLILCPTPVYRYIYFINRAAKKKFKLKTFPYPKKDKKINKEARYQKGKPYLKEGVIRTTYFKKLEVTK